MKYLRFLNICLIWVMLLSALPVQAAPAAEVNAQQDDPMSKVEPLLLTELAEKGATGFVVWMKEKADVRPAEKLLTKAEKGQFVYETLTATATRSQKDLRATLDRQGVRYTPFYIVNAIFVTSGTQSLVLTLATRSDVEKITANHKYQLQEPFKEEGDPGSHITAAETNLTFIKATDVWMLGYDGQGIVLAGNDTGLSWDHPAILNHYRGWNGATANHNYNWWDATGTYDNVPGDGHGHGTHTTGTMVGDDGGDNQIGVAPGATTIHCKNMTDSGSGDDTTFLTCFQFDLAPWDLTYTGPGTGNPRPDLAPDAVNNSWGYSPGGDNVFRTAIQNLQAAGILIEVSAGNEGPSCGTLRSPGDYSEVLTTGSVDHIGQTHPGIITVAATWSTSRGPSALDGNYFPDVMAPGNGIRSSLPGNTYASWGGTSMAGPHTTAVVGLMWSACPTLRGNVAETMDIIRQTAAPLTGQTGSNCGGDYTTGPNNDWGVGTIDALAAVQAAVAQCGGVGYLNGTVTDNATSLPLAGVEVEMIRSTGWTWHQTTNASGYYTKPVVADTYTVTANLFGYIPATVSGLSVVTDAVVVQDFALTPAPTFVVDGTVYDANTGWPLYAAINIAGYPYGAVWTNPETGYYSVTLPAGATYTFDVAAWVAGYTPASRAVTLSSDRTEDFALAPDLVACDAPGYSSGSGSCVVSSGGLVVGHTYDANLSTPLNNVNVENEDGYVTTSATAGGPMGDGFYTLFSPEGTKTFTATLNKYGPAVLSVVVPQSSTVMQDFYLPAGRLIASVNDLNVTLLMGENTTVPFDLDNLGARSVEFALLESNPSYTPSAAAARPATGADREASPTYRQSATPLAVGDLLDTLADLNSINGDYQNLGVEFVDGFWWVTGGASETDPNQLYKIDADGNLVAAYDQSSSAGWGWRDLAFDGDYLYSSDSATVVQIDPATGQATGTTIPCPTNPCRALAYDPDTDHFWTANFDSNIWEFDRTGAVIHTYANALQIYGAAWDKYSSGGPYLWVWSQDPGSVATQYAFDGVNLTPTGVSFVGDAADGAGGLAIINGDHPDFPGMLILAGLVQAEPDRIDLFDLDATVSQDVPWLAEDPITGTVASAATQTINTSFDAAVVPQPGHYHAQLAIRQDTPYPTARIPVTMTVLPSPTWGRLAGTVTGLGYCDANPALLEGAEVVIRGMTSTITLTTDLNGAYQYWFDEAESPLSVTVNAPQHAQGQVTGVGITGLHTTTLNFDLRWLQPCITVSPDVYSVTQQFGVSATFQAEIWNTGAVALDYRFSDKETRYIPATLAVDALTFSAPGEPGPMSVRSVEGQATEPETRGGPLVWSGASALPGGLVHYGHAQCADQPNSFYVIGGVDSSYSSVANAWRYDANTDTWNALAPYPVATEGPQAVCYEGYIYTLQGNSTNGFYIYDIAGDTWAAAASAVPHTMWGAALGAWGGKIYVVGGDADSTFGGTLNSVDIYDIATGAWSSGAPMPAPTGSAGYVQIDSYLYIVGGWGDGSPTTNETNTQRYDMATDSWSSGPTFTSARADFALAATGSALYAIGGDADGGGAFDAVTVIERLDYTAWPAGTWTAISDPLASGATGNNAGFCTGAGDTWSVAGYTGAAIVGTNQYRSTGEGCTLGGNDAPWIYETPITGTLAADAGYVMADVTLDAGYVNQPGMYYGELAVASNDPMYGRLTYPVTMVVETPPTWGILDGVVTSLGYCDANPAPLAGAEVVIQGMTSTITLTTNLNGGYRYWLDEGESPLTVTVNAPEHPQGQATGLTITGQQTTTQNFDLRWLRPCVSVAPDSLSLTLTPGTSGTLPLALGNSGAAPLDFELKEKDGGVFLTAGEQVLVVSYDDDAAASVEAALTTLGYSWLDVEYTAFQTMPVDELLDYEAVFYMGSITGDAWAKAMAYLDAGGALYISDNDLGYSHNTTTFYQTYLQAAYVDDDGVQNGGGPAVGEAIMTGLDLDLSTDPYPDYFTVGAEGARIFRYVGGDGDGYAAGAAVERGGYRAIYTAFDFDDMAANSDEVELVERIASFLGVGEVLWLSEAPITGTLAADGGSAMVDVTMDAATIAQPGEYYATLTVKNNDPLYGAYPVLVTMTVEAPATWGILDGVVTSLGYCDADPVPLEGAAVVIQGVTNTITLTTDLNGAYRQWVDESESPLTITVNVPEHTQGQATGVTITGQQTTTVDFDLRWLQPCVSVAPDSLSLTLTLGTTGTLPLALGNSGAASLDFELKEKDGGVFLTAGEQVLVVSYDNTAAAPVEAALTTLGYSWLDVENTAFQTMAVADLLEYKAVFYIGSGTGDAWAKARAYLDAGGALYISDNDLGYSHRTTAFYQTYLQAAYVEDDGVQNGGGPAVGEAIMAGLDLNLSTDPYPDYFTVGAEGARIFRYVGGDGDGYAAGAAVERGGYRAIYTAFDFNYMAANSDEVELVERIMDFLAPVDVPWLSEVPITGTLAADGGSAVVDVTMDASVMQPGEYYATLTVENNDPLYGAYAVPVTMVVQVPATWGKIVGYVTDNCTGAPITASIAISGGIPLTQTMSGADGRYSLWLEQGPYEFTFTAPDYLTRTEVMTILAQQVISGDITLLPDAPCLALQAPALFESWLITGTAVYTHPEVIALTNQGGRPLEYEIVEPMTWVGADPMTGTVPSLGAAASNITFTALYTDLTPMPLGLYTTDLQLNTNAGNAVIPAELHIIEEPVTPTAAFTHTLTCVNAEVTFAFTGNAGVPPADSYAWDFGDGVTTTLSGPEAVTHTYSVAGAYTVTLEVCESLFDLCDTHAEEIAVLGAVTADFDYSVAELSVTLVNSSTNAASYLWEFGDGMTSTLAAPSYTYAAEGAYTVTLYASNACGIQMAAKSVTVGLAPVVDFTSNSPVCLGDTAHFTSTLLTGTLPVAYLWDLGNGVTSTLSAPTHPYALAGSYPIALLASNDFGNDEVTGTLEVLPLATAGFDYASQYLHVVFTNTSQYADGYLWAFGDGMTSTLENPAYTYAAAGTYTVTLTAYNACQTDVATAVLTVDAALTYQLTVNADPAEGGSVELNPAGGLYDNGAQVILTATATTGWSFTGWTGDLSGAANPEALTMDSDKVVTATFAINTYIITPTAGLGGSITPATPQTVAYDGSQSFTITPDPDYYITNVGVDGVSQGVLTSYTFNNVRANHTISAAFAMMPETPVSYTLTVAQTGDGNGILTPTVGAHEYLSGTMALVSAVAQADSDFAGWQGACTGAAPTCALWMDADKAVTATFTLKSVTPVSYTLTVAQAGDGNGTLTPPVGGHEYLSGATALITATAAPDSDFAGWQGACTGATPTCAVLMDADKAVTATFTLKSVTPVSYTLTVAQAGTGNGTLTPPVGIHEYLSGATVLITATAQADSDFAGWQGACTGAAPTCAVLMNTDKVLTATFTLKGTNRPPVADAGGNQTVKPGNVVTLDGTASADPDGDPLTYGWTQVGGTAVSFTPTLSRTTFIAPEPGVLTFTLMVTDSLGMPALTPDTVVITVATYGIYLPLVCRNYGR